MRKSSLFIFASLLCMGALPASAAIHELGAVNVSADHYTNVTWTRFDGPVDRLSFLPATDAVDCDHITVNYLDGTSHDVFSGRLLREQRETISFPADQAGDRRLASVTFSCRAENVDGARIALSAVTDGDRFADDDFDRPAHLRTYEGGRTYDSGPASGPAYESNGDFYDR
ncbi:MAG TPA: hypothetical protein VN685_08120 [Rhizomicrobium sp.]|nr:hypothetical protein [Rhizomicrobium sp.]